MEEKGRHETKIVVRVDVIKWHLGFAPKFQIWINKKNNLQDKLRRTSKKVAAPAAWYSASKWFSVNFMQFHVTIKCNLYVHDMCLECVKFNLSREGAKPCGSDGSASLPKSLDLTWLRSAASEPCVCIKQPYHWNRIISPFLLSFLLCSFAGFNCFHSSASWYPSLFWNKRWNT